MTSLLSRRRTSNFVFCLSLWMLCDTMAMVSVNACESKSASWCWILDFSSRVSRYVGWHKRHPSWGILPLYLSPLNYPSYWPPKLWCHGSQVCVTTIRCGSPMHGLIISMYVISGGCSSDVTRFKFSELFFLLAGVAAERERRDRKNVGRGSSRLRKYP